MRHVNGINALVQIGEQSGRWPPWRRQRTVKLIHDTADRAAVGRVGRGGIAGRLYRVPFAAEMWYLTFSDQDAIRGKPKVQKKRCLINT